MEHDCTEVEDDPVSEDCWAMYPLPTRKQDEQEAEVEKVLPGARGYQKVSRLELGSE